MKKRRYLTQRPKGVTVKDLFNAVIIPENRAAKNLIKFLSASTHNEGDSLDDYEDFKKRLESIGA